MVKGMLMSSDKKRSTLAKDFDESFLELGRTLRQIQEIGGVVDFRKVCDAAGIGTRKAYYLASITKQIEGLHIPTKRLRAIGWTKLMTIHPHLTKATGRTCSRPRRTTPTASCRCW